MKGVCTPLTSLRQPGYLPQQMQRKRRYIVRLDEVNVTRDGDTAIIEYKEQGVMTTHHQR